MARAIDLMGLGLNPFLAGVMSDNPFITTVTGSSAGSATQVANGQELIVVTATATGNYIALLQGGSGALLGDGIVIANLSTSAVVVTTPTGTVLYGGGVSATGTTGVSVSSGAFMKFWPASTSVWVGLKGA